MVVTSWRALARAVVLASACAALAVGCLPPPPSVTPVDPSLKAYTLTEHQPNTNALQLAFGGIVASAPATNTGSGIRFAFTKADAVPLLNAESCGTWQAASGSTFHQEGATLRLKEETAGIKAITVTKNVWALEYWKFNVHLWDTSVKGAEVTQIGEFDLGSAFLVDPAETDPAKKAAKPFPWRICARAVGYQVSFVVWPLSQPRPAWGDPAFGRTVTVPAAYVYAGVAGWYAGHIQPNSAIGFTDLAVIPL